MSVAILRLISFVALCSFWGLVIALRTHSSSRHFVSVNAARYESKLFRNVESVLSGENRLSLGIGAEGDEPVQRKKKKNKYAKFSKSDKKKPLETVEEAMVNAKRRDDEKKVNISAAVRGTTIPTAKASPKIKRKVANFDNYRKIVPSDPSTFGYIEIGAVGPPHGIKGEVKITMDNTDFAEDRLSAGSLIYIKKPSRRSLALSV